ncbi:MAG: class I SAM-dependent methyltransferase [bacterium]|nr:class I SAM-dependent methyltransferase [bacterium]
MNREGSPGWDPVWEDIFSSQAWGRYPPEAVVRVICRTFPDLEARRAMRVLDLGCGTGAIAWFLAREGFRTSAIDASPSGIAQAGERLRREDLEAELKVGDFTQGLPWPDETFDAVVEVQALCCNPMAAIVRTVAEVERVLKPGGLTLSLSFTDRTWGYGRGRPSGDPGAFHEITEGPLQGLGLVQFLGRSDVDRIYRNFANLSVDRVAHTLHNGEKLIESWVIAGFKQV